MSKLRLKHYKLISRVCSHVALVIALSTIYGAVATPAVDAITWALCFMAVYMQHLLVGKELVELNLDRLKFLAYFVHIIVFLLLTSTAWSPTGFAFASFQLLGTVARIMTAFGFLNPRITISFEVLYAATEVFVYLSFLGEANVQFLLACLGQLVILIMTVASSFLLNLALRGRIHALLDAANAESLVSSFRRVLRGLCDGEVLLDSEMNVSQESECLKHLILTDVSLKGRSFEHLLAPEDQQRFREFIEASTGALDSAPPFCSRVGLRGSAGIRVAVDIYHVPVPGLFGADKPYHLIAFKEDYESRPLPDAEDDAIPAELIPSRARNGECMSMVSESTGQICVDHCPELQQMTLLVNVESELQDVEEAHLKFDRAEGEVGDLPSADLQSSMPSLRKFVKPMEWEKVCFKIKRFHEKASQNPQIPPKMMKRITFQSPFHRGWHVVEEASLHPYVEAGKVWLYLTRFHPLQIAKRKPSTLDGIQECLPAAGSPVCRQRASASTS